jgi:hypothetical protein
MRSSILNNNLLSYDASNTEGYMGFGNETIKEFEECMGFGNEPIILYLRNLMTISSSTLCYA